MINYVLAISGSIASGKTTLSIELSKYYNWGYASFGSFIRNEAIKRGIDSNSRAILQEIGLDLISKGWSNFCSGVLNEANWNMGDGLIIDGIRHLECLETLRKITCPMKLVFIFIEIDTKERIIRLKKRGVNKKETISFDKHETEQHLSELKSNSDIVVNASSSSQEIILQIQDFLNLLQ